MSTRRSFSSPDVRRKADDYHGCATFVRASPDLAAQGLKSLNLEVPFDQALRLSLALQSCLQAVNRYNRSTTRGKSMGVLLSIKLDSQSVSVIESPLKEPSNGSE